MEKKVANWQNAGIGLVTLGVIGWLIVALFSTVEQAPWPVIAIILTVFGSALTITSNLQTQIRNEQKEHKVEIYEQITHFFFFFLFTARLGQEPKTEKEITEFLIKVTPKLVMWGSDNVVKSFREFRRISIKQNSNPQNSGLELLLIYEQMLLNIRKDLGHQNQELKTGAILGIFINDIDEYVATATQLQIHNQTPQLIEADFKQQEFLSTAQSIEPT